MTPPSGSLPNATPQAEEVALTSLGTTSLALEQPLQAPWESHPFSRKPANSHTSKVSLTSPALNPDLPWVIVTNLIMSRVTHSSALPCAPED